MTLEKENAGDGPGKALHDLFREVFKLQALLAKAMDEVHTESGLTTAKHRVMRAMSRIEPATIPDLAAFLGVSRQFVQNVCNDLFAQELIEFRNNPRHKRSKWVSLTDLGRNVYQRSRRRENRIIEQAIPGIDPVRAVEARELLQQIRKALE